MAKSHEFETNHRKGLSRRAFLARGAGVAVTAPVLTGVGLPVPTGPAADVKIMGPGKVPVSLKINGKSHTLSIEPRVTLLDALRDHLDYTAAKEVCDRAVCGSCSVILGGKLVYACSILAIDAQGKDIFTVEGLTTDGKPHPIQSAFVQNDAQQCGYCTPGFIMACKDFLDKHPRPTMRQVEEGLGGNICRCGTYVGIRKAVLQAANAVKGGKTNA